MTTPNSDSNYILVSSKELEAWVADSAPISPKKVPRLNLDRLWNFLFATLGKAPEPKIRRICDRNGNTYFRVYDPDTGMTSTFASEQEVREWLDQRHYR